ncbi:MAG: ferredoxin--NADP reductase [Rhodococcus sp.]|nr:ferredoxin--NADP reductase [Rhodococcus sp. (in: high G+C Gram-positive bacteria)]
MTNIETPHSSRSALLTVSEIVHETANAHSLVFEVPADQREKFEYRPGQFLTLRIPSERTGSVARCYSLASSPHTDAPLKITVKRTDGGYGSNWICDHVQVGDAIEVLPPSGVFVPSSLDEDFLLFAAGSGITPIMSIVESVLLAGGGNVVLFYANRDESAVIFGDALRQLDRRFPGRLTVLHWFDEVRGFPSVDDISAFSAPYADHDAFMCGPGPFMDTAHKALIDLGVPRERVHREVFTSLSGDPFCLTPAAGEITGDAATAHVTLDGETHELRWPREQSLVDVMLAADLDVPYSCQEGECGSCACTVVDGEVTMPESDILDPEDIAGGYILGCQARPISDDVEIEF